MLFLRTPDSGFYMMHCIVAVIFTIIATFSMPAAAGAATTEQVEIPIPEGKLSALLYRPDGAGPFPAVIGLHGCGGVNGPGGTPTARYLDWSQRLIRAGF